MSDQIMKLRELVSEHGPFYAVEELEGNHQGARGLPHSGSTYSVEIDEELLNETAHTQLRNYLNATDFPSEHLLLCERGEFEGSWIHQEGAGKPLLVFRGRAESVE
ncbi:hypothetical protein CMI48_01360 [Candidatus Pacearchaeota archaeon]|jgi:hypothetical protein|nr:hypothetical protein [Candidatus Pacearchaeota archaeon]|tara:strand:+ start:1017 stop:1334 length:318 start_codon:yes stop_codon:yes gene_type:complete